MPVIHLFNKFMSPVGIRGKVASVGLIGIVGMAVVSAILGWALTQAENAAATIDGNRRVSSHLASFNHTISLSRMQFQVFIDSRGKQQIDGVETELSAAVARLDQIDKESNGMIAEADLRTLREMLATIQDSVHQIVPSDRRSGPLSAEQLIASITDYSKRLTELRQSIANDRHASTSPTARLQLAVKIGEILAIVAEAKANPDLLLQIRMSGEVLEAKATAASAGLRARPERVERLGHS